MNKPIRLLICIILSSAALMGCLVQVRADVVFQDSFEKGNFNKWTVVGSPSIVTSPTMDGSEYAAQFALNPTNTSSDGISYGTSYLQAPFPSSNTATLEFYLQTDTLSQNGSLDIAEIASPSDIPLSQDTSLVFLSILPLKNGSIAWAFTYPSGENTPIGSQTSVNHFETRYIIQSSAQTEVWYKFDIAISSSSNTIQLSINNSTVFTATNQFIWNPTVFKIGNILNYNYSIGNLYFDDVTVTNTASFTQSISTSTPTINPTATTTDSSSTSTSQSLSPTPNVPELSWLAILPLFISLLLVAVAVKQKLGKQSVT
jgi:hypothetical protein